jgi:hypothetical protein
VIYLVLIIVLQVLNIAFHFSFFLNVPATLINVVVEYGNAICVTLFLIWSFPRIYKQLFREKSLNQNRNATLEGWLGIAVIFLFIVDYLSLVVWSIFTYTEMRYIVVITLLLLFAIFCAFRAWKIIKKDSTH